MRTFRVAMLAAVVAGLTAGCLSVKSYVVPLNPKIQYADLLARPEPKPVALEIAFHRNGEPVNVPLARTQIRTVFERSKLFSAITDTPAGGTEQFDVVLDNRADLGEAASKGMFDLQKEERL